MNSFFTIVSLVAMCLASAAPTVTLSAGCGVDDATATAWADSVYESMNERQRVAQLFVPRLDIADNSSGRQQLVRMVDAGVGGFLLGKGSIADYNALITLAQSEARVPLLVTLDGEWGLSMRVKGTPRFPYNMGLGAIADERLLYDYGREVARECRTMGIQVDFAPVLDVNSNPLNPVIGYRSLGEDPQRVACLGVAYSRGLESGGVLSVAKHFPGHGDTSTDSHKALPTIDHSRGKLDEVDLLPFDRYIKAGMSGIMVGHLCVPALDKSGTPASMSAPVITSLLKEQMGFNGLVFTDALAMKGADSHDNNCVRALLAGADVLLGSGAPLSDLEAVLKAVESGRVPRDVIEARCKKMLRYKYLLGLSVKPRALSTDEVTSIINAPEAEDVNRRLSAASVTAVRNDANLLPVADLRKNTIAVVSLGAKANNEFAVTCARYADVDNYVAPDGSLTASQISAISSHDIVVVGIFSDNEAARRSMAKLDGLKNVIPVFFINPYKMGKFAASLKHHATLLTAYDDTPLLREYGAQAVFGGIPLTGRMPVNVKGVTNLGDGVDIPQTRLGFFSPAAVGVDNSLTAAVDRIVDDALANGAFPGCQVMVVKGNDVIIDKCYGLTTKGGTPVTCGTLYDVASMSKAVGTLAGLMKAYDEGLIDVDARFGDYVADADTTAVGDLSLRQLLYHESGLTALNMYKLMMDTATYTGPVTSRKRVTPYTVLIENGVYGNADARLRSDITSPCPHGEMDIAIGRDLYVGYNTYDSIMAAIYAIVPGAPNYRYSCLNFCLLMAAEEVATEIDHEQWVDLEVFKPLGACNTMYRPVDGGVPLERIAPTEHDRFLRRQTMHGYVHDELASFSGGVQGNAGLFSTAFDVAKYCRMLLNGGSYGGVPILKPATVDMFTTSRSKSGRRGLGFDIKKADGNRPEMYGHTGFTGTCFWVDPKNEIVFVFLSNRVNPSRDNKAWNDANVRDRLLRAVYDNLL